MIGKVLGIVFILIMTISCQFIDAHKFVNNLDKASHYNSLYKALKTSTEQGDGWIIVQDGVRVRYYDPQGYESFTWSGVGPIWAINLNDPDRGSYVNDLEFFKAERIEVTVVGWRTYKDSFGNVFENSTASSKDLEKMGSFIDSANKGKMAESLIEKFGMSEERGFEVAGLLYDYRKIAQMRSLTDRDHDIISKKLLGVDLKTAEEAFKGGDSLKLDTLIESAATLNGLSPEQVKELLEKEFLN